MHAREPQLADLVRALNAHHVLYVLIGGFAVIAHGGARTTKDIDLLIDAGAGQPKGRERSFRHVEGYGCHAHLVGFSLKWIVTH